MDRKFYVYIYFRPDGSPCYVGKGTGRRWLIHGRGSPNKHLLNIVKASGGDLPRLKIRENLTADEAKNIEIAMIAAIGREIDGGPLVNQTDGGDGCARLSPEAREVISATHRGRRHTEEWKKANAERHRGRVVTAEVREIISIKHMGIRPDVETRKKMSAAKLGKPNLFWKGRSHTESTKLKISASKKGVPSPKRGQPISADQKLKISSAMKGRPWSTRRRESQAIK